MLSRLPGVLPQGGPHQSEASWGAVASPLHVPPPLPHTQAPHSPLIRSPAATVNPCGRDLGPVPDGPPPSCPETPQMNPEMGCDRPGESKAAGKARRLMSKPALQQETKLHKDSGAGPSSGFLPSGPWSRIKLSIPAYPAFFQPPRSQEGGSSLSPTHPLPPGPWLPYQGVGWGAHFLLRLRTQGPHPCRPEVEREPSPLPAPLCPPPRYLSSWAPAPREGRQGECGPAGNLPGLCSRQYMKSMQMWCKNSMQISTSSTNSSSMCPSSPKGPITLQILEGEAFLPSPPNSLRGLYSALPPDP